MVKRGVLFEVRTGFLNIIWTSFGFKGLGMLNHAARHADEHFEKCMRITVRLIKPDTERVLSQKQFPIFHREPISSKKSNQQHVNLFAIVGLIW
jgi:hypothetical protein